MKLIQKYDKFYIRFIGGQHEDTLCDLLITNDEAAAITSNTAVIKSIFNEHKKQLSWTQEYFINAGLKDYMTYVCNWSEKRIVKSIEKFNRHTDIKRELYDTIMTEAFPLNSPVTVKGYTAERLNQDARLSVIGAYNYLIYLREDPKQALCDLKQGLPYK